MIQIRFALVVGYLCRLVVDIHLILGFFILVAFGQVAQAFPSSRSAIVASSMVLKVTCARNTTAGALGASQRFTGRERREIETAFPDHGPDWARGV